jgi:hypothetical protein
MYLKNNTTTRRRQYLHIDNLRALTSAATIAGNSAAALKIWLAVMHRARLEGTNTVQLGTEICRQFGITTRKAKDSGLRFWERVGVFSVERPLGKNPIVTIISKLGGLQQRCRITRNQVARMEGKSGNLTIFNEGEHLASRAVSKSDQKKLEAACLSGKELDVDLVDYGSGWLIEKIHPPSAHWQKPRKEIIMSATAHGSEAGGGGGQPLAQPQATAAPDSEAWFVTNYAISHAPLPTLPTQTVEPVTAAP